MARLSYPQLYDPDSPTLGLHQAHYDLITTYYDTGSVAVDAFEEWGALYSRVQPSMGYSAEPDFADPDYHADLPEDKAPYGRGINPDPDRGGSGALPVQMQAWTDAHDVPILLEHRVTGVFQNSDGAVVGVSADHNGTPVAFRARKAVVFGTRRLHPGPAQGADVSARPGLRRLRRADLHGRLRGHRARARGRSSAT